MSFAAYLNLFVAANSTHSFGGRTYFLKYIFGPPQATYAYRPWCHRLLGQEADRLRIPIDPGMTYPEDKKLFAVLARVAERRVNELSTQSLANMSWSYAKVSQQDEKLFAALERAAERPLSAFSERNLANTAPRKI